MKKLLTLLFFIFSVSLLAQEPITAIEFHKDAALCNDFRGHHLGPACLLEVYGADEKLFTMVFDFETYQKLKRETDQDEVIHIDLTSVIACAIETRDDLRLESEEKCVEYRF